MIIVTGGAGFIGSVLVRRLNREGYNRIVVVDQLGTDHRWLNLAKAQIYDVIGIDDIWEFLERSRQPIHGIFHMGACSSTTEADGDYLLRNNTHYSMRLFEICTQKRVPFIYASSAATYGAEETNFSDHIRSLSHLRPINKYGFSKHLFDIWAAQQSRTPPVWVGLKFFNVFGPNEYHKGSQASVVYHAFPQIRDNNLLKLFKSYRPEVDHGEQKRDFVYVQDVVDVMSHFFNAANPAHSGIYNVGTGVARSFVDLGRAVFRAMGADHAKIEFIEMPDNIKNQYQYFTQADLGRLRLKGGYHKSFTSLEDGISDYVKNYLLKTDRYV